MLLVSIITATYKRAHSIERTLESVMSQSYPEIEHIVVDGDSKDGTVDILKHYEHIYNLRWISEKDEGHSDACNKGVKMAHGEIIGFCNADDAYTEDAVKRAVEVFSKNEDVDLVFGDSMVVNMQDNSSSLAPMSHDKDMRLSDFLSGKKFFPQQTLFYRRRIIDKAGPVDTGHKFAFQYDWWIRMLKLGARSVYLDGEIMAYVGDYGDRNSNVHDIPSKKDWLSVLRKHGGRPSIYKRAQYIVQVVLNYVSPSLYIVVKKAYKKIDNG